MSKSKFKNIRANGFDSKREEKRFAELQMLERAGAIRNLQRQVPFELIPKQVGERACSYRADFVYDELIDDHWHRVIEDSKGHATPEWIIKRKLMLWRHGIRVRVS